MYVGIFPCYYYLNPVHITWCTPHSPLLSHFPLTISLSALSLSLSLSLSLLHTRTPSFPLFLSFFLYQYIYVCVGVYARPPSVVAHDFNILILLFFPPCECPSLSLALSLSLSLSIYLSIYLALSHGPPVSILFYFCVLYVSILPV